MCRDDRPRRRRSSSSYAAKRRFALAAMATSIVTAAPLLCSLPTLTTEAFVAPPRAGTSWETRRLAAGASLLRSEAAVGDGDERFVGIDQGRLRVVDEDDDDGSDGSGPTMARPRSRGADNSSPPTPSSTTRRDALLALSTAASTASAFPSSTSAFDTPNFLLPAFRRTDGYQYKQAKRSTAYLVDTTIPPTLVPLRSATESSILRNLGKGSGTEKGPYLQEKLNLNNIMNKGVFGAAKIIGDLARGGPEDPRSGRGYASFVFLGMTDADGADDVDLAASLLERIVEPRATKGGGVKSDRPTALGLGYAPLSTQGALDAYTRGEGGQSGESSLLDALAAADVAPSAMSAARASLPLLRLAKSLAGGDLKLLALAPEPRDVRTVRTQGLQNIDVGRRAVYVKDAEGFIAQTQDPRFRLYSDRSLLRDFVPENEDDKPGDYFAERILVHETAATVVAKWTTDKPDALVLAAVPAGDVRYMGGMNGRVVRVCKALDPEDCIVDEECVTTILINPTAESTLSQSKFLRLEIGTSPDNMEYQTKVADYLWFSRMPKVNMIPRMMNAI